MSVRYVDEGRRRLSGEASDRLRHGRITRHSTMAAKSARQSDVKTLASITGQPTEDVVAMLKQYDGDVNAATNALMDRKCA